MKVVVDANVFFLAFIDKAGSERALLRFLTKKGGAQLVGSVKVADELVRVFVHQAVELKLAEKSEDILFDLMKELARALLWMVPVDPREHGLVKKDPDDNKYMDAAIDGNVDYLISNDGHLLEFKGKVKRADGKLLEITNAKDLVEKLGLSVTAPPLPLPRPRPRKP